MRHWYAVIDNGGNWRVDWVTEVENAVCFVPACGPSRLGRFPNA